MKKVAVIILNWNGKNLLKKFLPSVVNYSEQLANIYVIDNASTDDSVEFIYNNYPQIKVINNLENLGFAEGYNTGLIGVDEEIYCLLNSDVEVTENWLNPVIKLFENKDIAVVQPKILDQKNREYFEYAGGGGGFLDNFGYPYCRGRVFWTLEKDLGQYNDEIPIFWASGACFFIRKKDFRNMNGFDIGFFAHMEEIDLCWRLQNIKRKVYYTGKSTVYHVGGATLSNSPNKTYLNFRNSLWMLIRNLPKYKIIPVIFSRLVLDGITALVFWRYEGVGHLKAIFFAHMDFYKKLKYYYRTREKTINDFWLHKFVPWQYFILRRKKLNNLK